MEFDDLNFIPVDREIMLDTNKSIVIKYGMNGMIEYVNQYYSEVTGNEVYDIVGSNIEDLRHPDVPKTVYNYMLDYITNGEDVYLLLKDQAQDGRFYWFVTKFEFNMDEEGNIKSIVSNRLAAPRILIVELEPLYRKIIKIEQYSNMENAKMYFNGFLEEKGMSLNDYTITLVNEYFENYERQNI